MKYSRYLKVAAVNALIGTMGSVIAAWFRDWNTSPLLFVGSVAAFTIGGVGARYLLDTRRLPGLVLRFLDHLSNMTWRDHVRWHMETLREYPALILAVTATIVWGSTAPELDSLPAAAQAIYRSTYRFGMVWMIASMVWMAAESAINRINPVGMIVRLMEQTAIFSLALVVIRLFGTELADIVESATARPEVAVEVGIAAIVLRIAYGLVPKRSFRIARENPLYGGIVGVLRRRPRSESDIRRTSVHEAGHLLTYACLSELPSRLTVEVLPFISDMDTYSGQVTHSATPPEVPTEGFIHWAMLLYLGGTEAERIVLGQRASGACEDTQQWLTAALDYLKAGFGEVFYDAPKTDAEKSHNRAVLNDLKARCTAELGDFLTTNKVLLEELAAAIAEKKSMTRAEIEPFLARAIRTEALPHAAYQ